MRTPTPTTSRLPFNRGLVWAIGSLGAMILGQVVFPQGREPTLVRFSLPELLEQASGAFAAGDFGLAADLFASVERDYGDEEAWQSGDLPRRILPLQGYAELKANRAAAAAQTLASFLDRYPDDRSQDASVRYTLAMALRTSGRAEEALAAFRDFLNTHPEDGQSTLARFQEAELLFQLDRSAEGLAVLDRIQDGDAAPSLKLQARLLGLRRAIENAQIDEATRRLLASPWQAPDMPEIAVLAFAGLDLGDRLLEADRPADAIRAYRLVPPKQRLIELQRERLSGLEARIDRSMPLARDAGAAFWIEFYDGMITRMRAQLAALEGSGDYTPSLMLRRAQAFLLAGRPREAWLVSEALATDEMLPPEVREEAHYRWILAAGGLDRWDDALAIGRRFVEDYPQSDRAPGAFYTMAQAHLEQRRLPEAAEVLSDLIERFPQDRLHGRFLFLRGYIRTLQEDFAPARADFEEAIRTDPRGSLAINCGLWHGLTFFFERDYPAARGELEALLAKAEKHPLYPEINYRIASIRYAQRDYEGAELELGAFLDAFPGHAREAEARVLLGDTLMAGGKLEPALEVFRRVPPEMAAQETYAVFQIGKILKALEDYEALGNHFRTYAARDNQPPRVSEALYWVGWAENRMEHPDEAEPVFRDALERFGNDPQATEINAILTGLERLNRRTDPTGEAFATWVELERIDARAGGRFTLFARLNLFLADRHLSMDRPYAAEALILEIAAEAPIEDLGPVALGRVGTVLMEIGAPSAVGYFERLLETYPGSFERAYAWYGQGKLAGEAGDDITAIAWLDRCPTEAPGHPIVPRALLAAAEARLNLGRTREAEAGLKELLGMKSARGRLHAEALRALAETALADGDSARAIACFQRIYTLYQAYDDLVAEAWFRSAGLFEERGDLSAAYNSYLQLATNERLQDSPFIGPAIKARDRLEPRIQTVEEPSP
ncbi:MAG: tetratricopeptide repeat protein [Opitutaceae bacterium]